MRNRPRTKIPVTTSELVYTTLSTWDTYRAAHPLYTILTPFEPYRQWPAKGDWNDYTEGGAMQYSWHVLHDAAGLAALHGGPAAFGAHLEKIFTDNTEVAADQRTGECVLGAPQLPPW